MSGPTREERFAERQAKLRALLEQREAGSTAEQGETAALVAAGAEFEPPANAPISMSVTDRRVGDTDATAFMEGLVVFANHWWRERAATGCAVMLASYADDVATIQTRPGPSALTIADVREAFKRKEAA